ncbi:MAG: hypothetical protein ACP5VE_13185 [Chthonomonadales bacterium]
MRFILIGVLFLLALPTWAQFGGFSLSGANLPRPSMPSLPTVQAAPTLPSVTAIRPSGPRLLVNPTAVAPTPEGLSAPAALSIGPFIQPPYVSEAKPVVGSVIEPVAAGYAGFLEPGPIVNQTAPAQSEPRPQFGPIVPAALDLNPVIVEPLKATSLEPAKVQIQSPAGPQPSAVQAAFPSPPGPTVPHLLIPVTDLFARPSAPRAADR